MSFGRRQEFEKCYLEEEETKTPVSKKAIPDVDKDLDRMHFKLNKLLTK